LRSLRSYQEQDSRIIQQRPGQWLVHIQNEEKESPMEARRRQGAQEIRELKDYLSKDNRFTPVTQTIQRLPPGRPRKNVLRQFWAEVYDDPLVQALRTGILNEHHDL
jgi:hypothetical protein